MIKLEHQKILESRLVPRVKKFLRLLSYTRKVWDSFFVIIIEKSESSGLPHRVVYCISLDCSIRFVISSSNLFISPYVSIILR